MTPDGIHDSGWGWWLASSRHSRRWCKTPLARRVAHKMISAADNTCFEYAWIPTSSPRQYQCSAIQSKRWSRLCLYGRWTATIDKPYPHVQRGLQLGRRPCGSAASFSSGPANLGVDVLRYLDNRTVAIIGDSTSHNLWCSLVCHFMLEANASLSEHQERGLAGARVVRMHSLTGRIDWVEPMPIENGARDSSLRDLRKLTTAARQSPADQKLVVLCNTFGLHFYRSELKDAAYTQFAKNRAALRSFQQWTDVRRHLCQHSKSGCQKGTMVALEHGYSRFASAYATLLAQLMEGPQGQENLGMIVETIPTHFPDVPGALGSPRVSTAQGEKEPFEDGLDELGSYERFVISSLIWIHQRLKRNATSLVLHAMQTTTPASSTWGPVAGHADPAYIIGFARSDEAAACTNSSATSSELDVEQCYVDALLAYPTAHGQRRAHFRVRNCKPHVQTGSAAAEAEYAGFRWRQRIEAQVAAAAGVPFFHRASPRNSRWDLHPGIKWAKYEQTTALFDCLHSVRTGGSFDGEMLQLHDALEARFGHRHLEQPPARHGT